MNCDIYSVVANRIHATELIIDCKRQIHERSARGWMLWRWIQGPALRTPNQRPEGHYRIFLQNTDRIIKNERSTDRRNVDHTDKQRKHGGRNRKNARLPRLSCCNEWPHSFTWTDCRRRSLFDTEPA